MGRIALASFSPAFYVDAPPILKPRRPRVTRPSSRFLRISAQKWVLPDGLTIIVQEDQQRAGGECAGVVRDRQHRRRPTSRRGAVAHSRAHAVQGNEDAPGTMRSRKKSRTSAVTSTPTRRSIARFSGSMCRRTASRPRSIFCPTR